jgi:hypothetical protein
LSATGADATAAGAVAGATATGVAATKTEQLMQMQITGLLRQQQERL